MYIYISYLFLSSHSIPYILILFFFLMIRRPPRSTLSSSSAASDVYKRQDHYLKFLKVFDECLTHRAPPLDFGARLVAEALSLDSAYLGEYAAVVLEEEDEASFSEVAALIMETEGTSAGEVSAVSPTRRSQHTTDGFVVLLLSMYTRVSMSGRGTPSRSNPFRSRWELSTEGTIYSLSLIHISEPTRLLSISYAVFCLKKKKTYINQYNFVAKTQKIELL
eukprot:TRINITY_DN11947_c0_g1_i1.p1 TRINITY_DN11947_c0_g1~~TRINITY_DN11947_c0_g1_i1.p1  ORF type:complete len:221 (-),score=34.51 TRINITY_DN11947_c0_g1_i1:51-713(-)